jgi:hypothetical protein
MTGSTHILSTAGQTTGEAGLTSVDRQIIGTFTSETGSAGNSVAGETGRVTGQTTGS